MAAASVTPPRYADGYPRSSPADLDPGVDVTESLEDADREACQEQRFAPEGRGPDASIAVGDSAEAGDEP